MSILGRIHFLSWSGWRIYCQVTMRMMVNTSLLSTRIINTILQVTIRVVQVILMNFPFRLTQVMKHTLATIYTTHILGLNPRQLTTLGADGPWAHWMSKRFMIGFTTLVTAMLWLRIIIWIFLRISVISLVLWRIYWTILTLDVRLQWWIIPLWCCQISILGRIQFLSWSGWRI